MFLRSEVPNLSIYKVAKHVGGYNIKLELQLLPSFEKWIKITSFDIHHIVYQYVATQIKRH